MFRRTFWFTAGAAAGVWATTKVNRKLKQLTPESLAARAADKAIEGGHKLKDFALDVRDGMVRREAELGRRWACGHRSTPSSRYSVISRSRRPSPPRPQTPPPTASSPTTRTTTTRTTGMRTTDGVG